MTEQRRPNVFTIAPGVPFLTTLVNSVRSGALGWAAPDPSDPLGLASTSIYVPTRRAARELRAMFAQTSGTRSAILPVIKPLGEFDEDASFFTSPDADELSLDPPIAADERILTLARLTSAWKAGFGNDLTSLIEGEPVMLPATPADAIWLARDLAALMDEMEREGVTWLELAKVDSEALAGWWQHTLKFLEIVTDLFPKHLAAHNLSDPVAHRNAILRAEARRLNEFPPMGPVIAAGSTGSIPATADLLAVISRLPQGAVVLPGLDRDMDEETWQHLGAGDAPKSICGHPQFGLMKLLKKLGANRNEVQQLEDPQPYLKARETVVSEALRPAETTHLWAGKSDQTKSAREREALSGVALIEAPGEREEALAIAIALREAIDERREHSAALVTPDRNLARRVSAELLRFGIVADDSGGAPLSNSPQAILFQTLLRCVFEPADPVDLLLVLKHPLSRFGQTKRKVTKAAEALELVALRGIIGQADAMTLGDVLEDALLDGRAKSRKPPWVDRVSAADIEAAKDIAAAFKNSLAPLQALAAKPNVSVSDAIDAAVATFEEIGLDETGSLAGLYDGDQGEAFSAHLRGLISTEAKFEFTPDAFVEVHKALISSKMVKPKSGSDPNVFIWGSLEARLQEVDTIILGSLNEGSWPGVVPEDPFLSRGMKSNMQLDPPERRVGQAAHDFQMAMGTPKVILTRSLRVEGAPSVASRWLQRLTAFAGKERSHEMRQRGAHYLHWAEEIDRRKDIPLEPRPAPKPPLELRPKHVSITKVEALRRDPYSIYARDILKLVPLDPLVRVPDERERGTLFHEIMHRFIKMGVPEDKDNAETKLWDIAFQAFQETVLPLDVRALWWPRFERLIEDIVKEELKRLAIIDASFLETTASSTAISDTGVTISGRADRIDVLKSGGVDILDYKSGDNPKDAIAAKLQDPQLALEAALAKRGSFQEIGPQSVKALMYYRLKSKGKLNAKPIEMPKNFENPDALGDKAWGQLIRLIASFNDPATPYTSNVLPPRRKDQEGDYDHLARVLEWSAGMDGEETSDE
jgi:ATP-dependent helicase/nuclease subunit B